MLNKEVWRTIIGYENYQVSNMGNVRNSKLTIMKLSIKPNGYLYVNLYNNGKSRKQYIHRLVGQSFIPNPNNLPEINHINEVRSENNVENLEWCTSKYNSNFGNRPRIIGDSVKKPIIQYDIEGNKIRNWDSASEVKCGDCHFRGISACLNGRQKTHRGFIWRYVDEDINE